MPLYIVQNDIAKMCCDAIVNAANSQLKKGNGVCGAIFAASDADALQRACDELAPCPTGSAVYTAGFGLQCRTIIHAVGPKWGQENGNEEILLRSAYRSALRIVEEQNCESAAFPLISAGIYGFPQDGAFHIAVEELNAFLEKHDTDIYLVIYNREKRLTGNILYSEVQNYLNSKITFVEPKVSAADVVSECIKTKKSHSDVISLEEITPDYDITAVPKSAAAPKAQRKSSKAKKRPIEAKASNRENELNTLVFLEQMPMSGYSGGSSDGELIKKLWNVDESFSEMVLRLIRDNDLDEVKVYKAANLDRKLFHRLRSNKDYQPSKNTALALAVGLRLNVVQTRDLLEKAGYALSRSSKMDLIIEFFLERNIYDIMIINETLFDFHQPQLGAKSAS